MTNESCRNSDSLSLPDSPPGDLIGSFEQSPDPKKFTSFPEYLVAVQKKNYIKSKIQDPIELMGVLSDSKTKKYIEMVGDSFSGISKEQIIALIQRESGGNPRAISSSGSRGIMQLTTSVFADMHKLAGEGRGIGEYFDNFQKIKPDLLNTLRGKFPEFVGNIEKIQNLSPKDQKNFTLFTSKVQGLTRQSTDRGEIELNILMGSLYLDSINDRAKKIVDSPKQGDVKSTVEIIKKLRCVSLNSINEMLTVKKFKPLSKGELATQIENIINNKEKYTNFLTNYNYNGQKSIDSDGSEHRIKYGLVVSISTDQLVSKNRL